MHKKTCSKCGVIKTSDNSFLRKNSSTYHSYCKACNNLNVTTRQREFKQKCINYKGGSCIYCGYNSCLAALEFHHIDPTQKDFEISNIKYTSWDKNKDIIIPELDKCELVCSNCHKAIHFDNKFQKNVSSSTQKLFKCTICGQKIVKDNNKCINCIKNAQI